MLNDTFVISITNHTQGCEFPFSLCRQTVIRHEDTVLATHLTRFATGTGVEIFELCLGLTTILTCKIDIGLECRLTTEVGKVKNDDTLVDENLLIDAVSTPYTIFRSLLPSHADNRILVVDGALEVIIHKAFTPCQPVTPAVGVRINGTYTLGIFLTVGTCHPINIFAI